MNSSISNSKPNTKVSWFRQLQRFLEKFLIPFLLVLFSLCYMLDRVVRDRLIFRNPSLGAAKIHRIIHLKDREIPIIGSSRALGSYIPDSLGEHFHNYGINGTGFEVMDMFLKIECGRSEFKSPIILNFDYELWNRSIGDINNYIPNIRHVEVKSLLKELEYYKIWYEFYGIRFFSNYDTYIKDYLNYRTQLTKVMTKGASLDKNKLTDELFNKLIQKRMKDPGEWKPHQDQVDRLMGHFASRRDRMFFVVVAPYHKSYYDSFKGMPAAQAFLDKIDKEPNVRVMEFNGSDYPDSLFVNTTHINYFGAQRFTLELRDQLFGPGGIAGPDPDQWIPLPEAVTPRMDTLQPDSSRIDTALTRDSL